MPKADGEGQQENPSDEFDDSSNDITVAAAVHTESNLGPTFATHIYQNLPTKPWNLSSREKVAKAKEKADVQQEKDLDGQATQRTEAAT